MLSGESSTEAALAIILDGDSRSGMFTWARQAMALAALAVAAQQTPTSLMVRVVYLANILTMLGAVAAVAARQA